MNSTKKMLKLVEAERLRQDAKWGENRQHSLPEWLAILSEEYGEVAHEVVELNWTRYTRDERELRLTDLRTELLQLAAVAVCIAESVDNDIDWTNL